MDLCARCVASNRHGDANARVGQRSRPGVSGVWRVCEFDCLSSCGSEVNKRSRTPSWKSFHSLACNNGHRSTRRRHLEADMAPDAPTKVEIEIREADPPVCVL
jgi:hypothetical protein